MHGTRYSAYFFAALIVCSWSFDKPARTLSL